MSKILSEYYRTPLVLPAVYAGGEGKDGAGFFRFGAEIVCYGECSSGVAADVEASVAFDVSKAMVADSETRLPFDISKIIDNLQRERYVKQLGSGRKGLTQHAVIREAYYSVRELLPVWVRRHLQKAYFRDWQSLQFPHWPVDF